MNVLVSPLEVVDVFARTIALLQNKGVVEQLRKLGEHIDVRVVGDAAGELSHFALFRHKLLGNAIQVSPHGLKAVEIELVALV